MSSKTNLKFFLKVVEVPDDCEMCDDDIKTDKCDMILHHISHQTIV